MDLTHHLRVPAPLDEAWAVVNDPTRLGALVPGSLVDGVAGDTFTGTMKIKLGSSLLALAGGGRYVARDDGQRRVVVATNGTDRRGDAVVEATHTLTLSRAGGSTAETDVTVATSLTCTGRPSRLGDGVLADAVDRVVEHVTSRIAARVADGQPWAPAPGTQPAADDASVVVDHPVALGGDLGRIDESDRPHPSPSPGPAPRPPARPAARPAQEYVYRPYSTSAEPHLEAARTFGRVVVKRALPYAGLGALAVFAAASAVRRARR